MKVLLIGNYARNEQESIQRYSDLMLRGLKNAGYEARLLHPPRILGWKGLPGGFQKWLGYVDRFLLALPRLRHELKWADVVHMTDTANAVLISHIRRKPVIVTCHDMTSIRASFGELEHSIRWSGRIYQRWILDGMTHSAHIVCVSEKTRSDVLRILNCPPDRASVVYNALHYSYSPMGSSDVETWFDSFGFDARIPFLMHVGDNAWNKNREGVIRIFAHLANGNAMYPGHLVMVGKPWTRSMHSLIRAKNLEHRIHQVIGVPDEGLRALYSKADALLFPSLYEGFGWPIVEAQACGCLVITSGRPPMTEVGANAAVYIDPTNEGEAAMTVANVLRSGRDRYVRLGFRNAGRFTADAMVAGYIKAYREALNLTTSGV